MRWLTLYLRSRRVPAAGGAILVAVCVFWGLNVVTNSALAQLFGVLAVALCTSAAAASLGSADPDLDRTAAIAWPPRRAAHVVAIGVVSALLVLVTQASDNPLGSTETVLRAAAGLTGLTALGVTLFGAQLGWVLPTTQAIVAMAVFFSSKEKSVSQQVFSWPFQPDGTTAATVTAVVLAVAGLVVHAVFGSKRVRTRQ
ncbi:hypothetical protein ACFWY9_14090 [Amycolatopsis sp. NPDC059027]|uniref:hypothetical protein n=1 Tax=unclassified Amycolatopsis TaxID=2618356 RepID=UPI00366AA2DA